MARTQGIDFRKSQGDRRLAPAQIVLLALTAFVCGVVVAGNELSILRISGVFLLASFIFYFRDRRIMVLLVPALGCLLGFFYYQAYFSAREALYSLPPKSVAVFEGIVISQPGHSEKSEHFVLSLSAPWRGKVRIIAPPASGFKYGDLLEIKGKIQLSENRRDLAVVFFPEIFRLTKDRGSTLIGSLLKIKAKLLSGFPRYLSLESSAFLGGITFGARSDMPPDFLEALSASGTTHLVALSGYNIAILIFAVFGICLQFFSRRLAFYLCLTSIFIFALMVGAEPSVVRASIMGALVLWAREIGRLYSLLHAFAWTAVAMILFNPASLFMPGFQLSFMALLGIVYVSPVISSWLGLDSSMQSGLLLSFKENIALTVAAQLTVAPIIINSFGGLSITSVMANALILPFMPLTMFLGFLLSFSSLISIHLGAVLALLAKIFLDYEIGVIRLFAKLDLPIGGHLSWFWIVVYYGLIFIIARRYQIRTQARRILNGG